MLGIFHDAAIPHRCRETDRNDVVAPAFRSLLDLSNQLPGRKPWTGIEFALFTPGNHQLHVGAADVDDQDLFHGVSFRATVIGVSLIVGAVCDSASLRAWPRDRSRKWSCACDLGAPSSGFR